MSVTIHWKPLSTKERYFKSGTGSDLTVLDETFGREISVHDVPTLRAMARAARNEFFNEVADEIEKVGDIKVWGEY